jgi:hypothetical protein
MDDIKRIAGTIRDYIAREHISRDEFAFRTKLGRSTVDKLLVGLFSERTLSVVEAHTGLTLRTWFRMPPKRHCRVPKHPSWRRHAFRTGPRSRSCPSRI